MGMRLIVKMWSNEPSKSKMNINGRKMNVLQSSNKSQSLSYSLVKSKHAKNANAITL